MPAVDEEEERPICVCHGDFVSNLSRSDPYEYCL